ncbi:hypothetical protein PMX20_08705, partial [Collinsella aerofaciens]|uniref:hypothetical protein n=1 Tax=Collinsella aerofaciens TaxID=74426 RepID=UPI00232E015E
AFRREPGARGLYPKSKPPFLRVVLIVEHMVAASAPGSNGQQSSVNGICSKKNKDKQIIVAVGVRMCSNKHEQ